ncbi:MAG: sugar MFS transporter [Lewinellaceae bacterium]|nr:sugar MFS transporter [Phaeodactylibacter sp.]MCB0615126.1 sugar MFS transporter [Phaeodactylibacter sp.]MCB9346331.1 sugar MFS transporter [Lewinellaceae bacterium]
MQPNNYRKPFITITFLFFMWGFITVMNDVLIPHLKSAFALSYLQASLVQSAFFGAFFFISLFYFLISISTGDPIVRIGYKNAIIIGLVLCGLGCALFYPAAQFQKYGFFLGALFVLASGVTILQIAANPYAARLGPPETESSRLNLAQGFNSVGTTLAPVVGAILIYKVFSDGAITIDSLKAPYLIFGSTFILLALLVKSVYLPKITEEESIETGAYVLKYRHLMLGMIAIFCYVGGEVAIGSFLINFFKLGTIMGFEEAEGSKFLSFYWGGAMIGRFLGSVSMGSMANGLKKYALMAALSVGSFLFIYLLTGVKHDGGTFYFDLLPFSEISLFLLFLVINYLAFFIGRGNPARTLSIFAASVIALLLIMISTNGAIAFWSAIAIGAFNSILWSNIFTLAIKDLGKYTSQGSSLLVMMIVGGAIVPAIQGWAADVTGNIQLSFIVPMLCYVYVLSYGLWGHRVVPINESTAPG